MSDERLYSEAKEGAIPEGQGWLIEKMKALKEGENPKKISYGADGGICFAIALLGLRALFLGDDRGIARFDQRLKIIRDTPLAEFKERLIKKSPLVRADMLAFFDTLELLQHTRKHPELFGGVDLHWVSTWPVSQNMAGLMAYPCYVYVKPIDCEEKDAENNVMQGKLMLLSNAQDPGKVVEINQKMQGYLATQKNVVYTRLNTQDVTQFELPSQCGIPTTQDDYRYAASLTCPDALKDNDLILQGIKFSGAYDIHALRRYFLSFSASAKHAKTVAGLLIGDSRHAISIGYNPADNKWTFIDANNLQMRYSASAHGIADLLLYSLSKNNVAIFETTLMGPKPNEVFCYWKESLNDLHAVNKEKAAMLDSQGSSWLYIAAKNGDIQTVEALLANGAAVNQAQPSGFTPLYIAAQHGHLEVVKRLLKEKNIRARQANKSGFIPLHIAACAGHIEIVRELLKHEGEIAATQKTSRGLTALQFAKMGKHKAIVQLLKPYQKQESNKENTSPKLGKSHSSHFKRKQSGRDTPVKHKKVKADLVLQEQTQPGKRKTSDLSELDHLKKQKLFPDPIIPASSIAPKKPNSSQFKYATPRAPLREVTILNYFSTKPH